MMLHQTLKYISAQFFSLLLNQIFSTRERTLGIILISSYKKGIIYIPRVQNGFKLGIRKEDICLNK